MIPHHEVNASQRIAWRNFSVEWRDTTGHISDTSHQTKRQALTCGNDILRNGDVCEKRPLTCGNASLDVFWVIFPKTCKPQKRVCLPLFRFLVPETSDDDVSAGRYPYFHDLWKREKCPRVLFSQLEGVIFLTHPLKETSRKRPRRLGSACLGVGRT